MPQMLSASPNAGSVGGPSAVPVRWANPLIASASVPNPAREAYGPVCPKPVIRAITRPGLTRCSSSGPMPQRSSVPGRKFSTSTSARSASRSSSAAPSGADRFSPISRLLREISFHHRGWPSLVLPWPRMLSPMVGCSIFTTSAP